MMWLGDVAAGRLRDELRDAASPSRDEFIDKFPLSFELLMLATLFTTVIGLAFGILSAIYRNRGPTTRCAASPSSARRSRRSSCLTLLVVIPAYLWNYSMPVGGDV